ncbi:MAG TPA: hypothetical protein PLA68_05220, partial [Panacibacter sp.]|nr:hypothetical protein [Panacibacter sp.]
IEGAAAIGNEILLSNRGNKNRPDNHLIKTVSDFFTKQEEIISGIAILDINRDNAAPAGVSALCYSDCNDTLFFTASTELTENAIDDGEIGDSYLGMVQQISLKLEQEIIEPDMMINLSKSNSVFNTEKIESLCIEQHDKERIIFHLVSDNDDGKTGLFKIAVTGF